MVILVFIRLTGFSVFFIGALDMDYRKRIDVREETHQFYLVDPKKESRHISAVTLPWQSNKTVLF